MSNWYVGQKVVCVGNPVRGPLSKGQVCIVADISQCSCGIHLHIEGCGSFGDCHCGKCGEWIGRGMWHGLSTFFHPIEDISAELARKESERLVPERPDHLNVPKHV